MSEGPGLAHHARNASLFANLFRTSEVGIWTRELIDAALDLGGSYYLPYQLHPTEEQFHRAYPRAAESIALKQRLDPTNKFRNELIDKYLHASKQ